MIKPGGLSSSVSKTASAGASDAPQICASTKEEAMKQLASSMAGAHAAGRGLAAAHKKAQKEKSSKAFSKLAAMKMHAHKASFAPGDLGGQGDGGDLGRSASGST